MHTHSRTHTKSITHCHHVKTNHSCGGHKASTPACIGVLAAQKKKKRSMIGMNDHNNYLYYYNDRGEREGLMVDACQTGGLGLVRVGYVKWTNCIALLYMQGQEHK